MIHRRRRIALIPLAAALSAAGLIAPAGAAVLPASALLDGLRSEGWRGVPYAPAPASFVAPAASPARTAVRTEERTALTDAQIEMLRKVNAEHGHDVVLPYVLTDALGLSSGAPGISTRQLSALVSPGRSRIYQRVTNGGFLFIVTSPEGYKGYLADSHQDLVGAVSIKTGWSPVTIPVADAQKELKAELLFWIDVANDP